MNRPFLSVVMRTQGRRPEALAEALLCLEAQSCQDFEVLLLGHKVPEKERAIVMDIIDDCSDSLKEKLRYIDVLDGGRARPLNVGIEEAKGHYFCIFDDDDIVFDHWVEVFKDGSDGSYKDILHSYCISQAWESVPMKDGRNELRASGSPGREFCVDYDIIGQYYLNRCPIMTLAFPVDVIRENNITFDETLTTVEDWDFLLRSANKCVVKNIDEPTSIYRLWQNAESSHALHQETEWRKNEKYVREKLEADRITLQPGGLKALEEWSERYRLDKGRSIYVDFGEGYSEETRFSPDKSGLASALAQFSSVPHKKVNSIRFDPSDEGLIMLDNLTMDVFFEDDTMKSYTFKEMAIHNGKREKQAAGHPERLAFFEDDPWVVFEIKEDTPVVNVSVRYNISAVTADMVRDYWMDRKNRKDYTKRTKQA